jgi:hypothetical protein
VSLGKIAGQLPITSIRYGRETFYFLLILLFFFLAVDLQRPANGLSLRVRSKT